MKKLILLPLLVMSLQACTTISFVKSNNDDRTTYSQWHHDWFYIIEGSDPVDMSVKCRGASWKTIRTEQSFLQGFVAGLTSGIYTPHGVEYSCMRTAAPASATRKK